MTTRVVATDRAKQAARQLQQIVNGNLSNDIARLRSIGQVLSNPANWESSLAQEFRGRQWPQMTRAMQQQMSELGKLRASSQKIVDDILHAGTEGGGEGKEGAEGEHESFWHEVWEDADKLNIKLAPTISAIAALDLGAIAQSTAKFVQAAREVPDVARTIFSDTVGEVGLAYDRGEATLAELEQAAARAASRIEIAETFVKGGAFKKLASGFFDTVTKVGEEAEAAGAEASKAASALSKVSGVFDTLGKLAIPLAVVGDVLTIINPGEAVQGVERGVVRGAAIANIAGTGMAASGMLAGGLLAANSLDWVPVAGQVIAVGTAVFLAGDWAYHTFPGFRNFCNTVGHDTVAVAKGAWNGIKSAGSAVKNFVSHPFGL